MGYATYTPTATDDHELRFMSQLPVSIVIFIIDEDSSNWQVLGTTKLWLQRKWRDWDSLDMPLRIGEPVMQK
jgi:hypothetical protein